MNRSRIFLAVCLASTTLGGAVQAQNIPGAAQPGREQENLSPIQGAPAATQEIIAPALMLSVPANAESIKLTLKSVEVTGNTAYSDAQLSYLYDKMIGTQITLADVYDIANAITNHYRKHGYIISQAVIPPQEIQGGAVKIRVVEGFVDDIQFKSEGGEKLNRDQLEKASAIIRASKPLNKAVLERQMLLMNDLAGVQARAVVQPSSKTVGAADLVIEVRQRKYAAVLQVDNRGSRYIGPMQYQARGIANGVFADYDQLQALYATSGELDELHLGEIRHIIPIGQNGLKGIWRAEYSNSAPGYNLEAFDVKGKNFTLEGQLAYPVVRGRASNLEVFGGLAVQDLQTKSLGVKISDERVSVANLGLNYDRIDTLNGRSTATLSVSRGLGIFGASDKGDPLLSRLGAQPQFTKFNGSIGREQFFRGSRVSVLTAAAGQYTRDSLIASQEFGLGGGTYGRGYDPSEITGDSGVSAKLELRYTGDAASSIVNKYQPYAFYDVGYTVDNKTGVGVDARNSLASAGAGVRLALAHDFSVELELAKPLTRNVAVQGDNDMRAFFTLSKAF